MKHIKVGSIVSNVFDLKIGIVEDIQTIAGLKSYIVKLNNGQTDTFYRDELNKIK